MKDTKPMEIDRTAVEPSEWRKTVSCVVRVKFPSKRPAHALIIEFQPEAYLTVWTTMS